MLVTGADGFMGSHLTDALVELGANVHAFVRATSSGALNNIGAPAQPAEGALRRPHGQDVDRLPDPRAPRGAGQAVRLPPRRAGARRRVVAPAVRDGDGEHGRHAQPAAVDRRQRARAREVRHRRARRRSTATSARRSRTTTTSTTDGGLILHERSPINPKSIYATAKVAADFLTMNYHDAFGVPGRRDADVQQLRAAPEPALRHRHDHHAGARARDDRARRARAAARLLLLHRRRPRPPHRRGAGHSRRPLRLRPGQEHLDARLGRPDPPHRARAGLLGRPRDRDDAAARAARARAR